MAKDTRTPEQIQQDNLLGLEQHLEDIIEYVQGIKDASFGHVRLRIQRSVLRELAFVKAFTGNVTNIARSADGDILNPLLGSHVEKRIMGKLVGDNRKPVTGDMTKPQPDQVAKFAANVDDLYKGFLSLKDKDVIELLRKPGGEALLRGVAKLAGVPTWQSTASADIDVMFFADIREGIETKNKEAVQGAAINKRILDNDADIDVEEVEEVVVPAKKAAAPVVKKAAAPKKSALDEDDEE